MFRPVSSHASIPPDSSEPAQSPPSTETTVVPQRSGVDGRLSGLQGIQRTSAARAVATAASQTEYQDSQGVFEGMREAHMAVALDMAAQRDHPGLGQQYYTPKGIRATSRLRWDPETHQMILASTAISRQKVIDPATGETVSKTALAKRQNKVVDPATGETVSKNALAKRQKVVDPATGETVSKNMLNRRKAKRRKEDD